MQLKGEELGGDVRITIDLTKNELTVLRADLLVAYTSSPMIYELRDFLYAEDELRNGE